VISEAEILCHQRREIADRMEKATRWELRDEAVTDVGGGMSNQPRAVDLLQVGWLWRIKELVFT